jgi:hypothetical protein
VTKRKNADNVPLEQLPASRPRRRLRLLYQGLL